ncbi:MAG: hypothetical protein IPF42_12590 [Candidatus Microthrix sp.]|nr:hypothetical protein [Candidatus Microthrix sp.]
MANESSATRRRTRVSVAGWYLLLTGLSLIILFPVWMTIVRALSEPFIYIEEGQPLYPVSIDWGSSRPRGPMATWDGRWP